MEPNSLINPVITSKNNLSWAETHHKEKHQEKHSNRLPLHSVLTEKIFVWKTHQVGLGHVLVFRAVICWRFAEAVVGGCLRGLSVLSVRGALRTPAEQTDGFPNASLDVNFYTTKEGNAVKTWTYGHSSSTFKDTRVQVTKSLMVRSSSVISFRTSRRISSYFHSCISNLCVMCATARRVVPTQV